MWFNEEVWFDFFDFESEDDVDFVKYVNVEVVSEVLIVVMDMFDLCDVMFLVGSILIFVYGVKFIMFIWSRYFYFFLL